MTLKPTNAAIMAKTGTWPTVQRSPRVIPSCGVPHTIAPMHAFEHLETYLRGVFGFVGVTRLEVFAANGIAMGEAARTEALENASQAIASLTV